jgi:plastocyanin
VTWVNNAGFPHNIVFDEDAIPAGVNAEALGQEDYLNAPGETVTNKFDVAGEYNYYCQPHQGAGEEGGDVVGVVTCAFTSFAHHHHGCKLACTP